VPVSSAATPAKALARAGYLPVTFDNLERGHERAVKWGPLESPIEAYAPRSGLEPGVLALQPAPGSLQFSGAETPGRRGRGPSRCRDWPR
jgi:hypothetical protein